MTFIRYTPNQNIEIAFIRYTPNQNIGKPNNVKAFGGK
jgi:hypothetical protein